MMYLAIFWIGIVLFFGLYGIAKWKKAKRILDFCDVQGGFFSIIFLILVIMAILTKDPLSIAGYTFPTELQWFSSLTASGFVVWRFYLNPLKGKVYELDREMGEVQMRVHRVENDVSRLIKLEKEFGEVRTKVNKLEKDVTMLVQVLIFGKGKRSGA